jgi:hypothetical protein
VILARLISVLFHPLLIATYLFSLFAFTFPLAFDPLKEDTVWNFVFLIFCVTFVMPVLNIGMFRTFGSIRSFAMVDRHERLLPFSFITILYCVVTYLFYSRTRVGLNDNLLKFMIIIDLLVLVATIATFFFKVSVHSLAIWGLIGILFPMNKAADSGIFFYPTVISIVLAGIVMSARLKLNVHTPREVTLGALLGFVTSFLGMILLF